MKFAFITLMILTSLNARAHHIEGHEMPDFIACEQIQTMAILNKDNGLYWAQQPADAGDVQACYHDVLKFANIATPDMITRFENEYAGQIRIFNNDKEFVQFMHENGDTEVSADINALNPNSKLTVVTPGQPNQLFEGLFQ